MAKPKSTAAIIRFDVANPRAEARIERFAGRRITEIVENTRSAVRATILSGYEQGQGPRSIALDLVGRINTSTGQREGGVIGLTSGQAQAATNLRSRLLSGDPEEMVKVFNMSLRDKRFDSTIQKAIENEEPVPTNVVDTMFDRYTNNALKLRGETIARTETGDAVHEAAQEAFEQGLEKTGYSKQSVTKVWRSASDDRVRDTHAEMDGQEVVGIDTPFTSPSGAQMKHPLDGSLGAPPEEIINCRCDMEINIDFSEGLE